MLKRNQVAPKILRRTWRLTAGIGVGKERRRLISSVAESSHQHASFHYMMLIGLFGPNLEKIR